MSLYVYFQNRVETPDIAIKYMGQCQALQAVIDLLQNDDANLIDLIAGF